MEKFKKYLTKKNIYIASGIFTVLIIIILFSVFNGRNADQDEFLTSTVEKGNLIAIVGATGKVKANQSADLTWKTSGNIADVNVESSELVKKDQVLSQLSQTTLPQSVILAQADLVEAQKNLERALESDTGRAQAYSNLLEAEDALKTAKEDRDDWNYNNTDQDVINTARSDFIIAEEEVKNANELLISVSGLAEDDPEKNDAQDEYDVAEENRNKALRNLNYLLGKSYDQQVADDYADYEIALAKLEDTQREWDKYTDGQNQDDIKAAQARVDAAQATISLASIKAPFDGTITDVFVKAGDEVAVGNPAFRIDDLSKLYAELDIPEIDIHRVMVGQDVELTFDALLDKVYHGTVYEVAGAASDVQGEVKFRVTILFADADEKVLPGMTSAVNIIVNQLENVLIVPNRAIRLSNGDRIVFIQRNGDLEMVNVEIGVSSDSTSQILSGDIEEGDILILNPPVDFFNQSGPPPFVSH